MPLKAIFFDAAGTLIQVREPVAVTYARIAAAHGVQTGEGELKEAFRAVWLSMLPPQHPPGSPPDDDDRSWWLLLVGRVFARALGRELETAVLEPLFDELYRFYAHGTAWLLFDDVTEALNALRAEHRLLVVSNFDRRLRSILADIGVDGLFDEIIISSEVGSAKPDARIFQVAIAAAGCAPHQCLHVGDDERCDIDGAQACGLHAFAVARPHAGLMQMVQKVRSGAYSSLRRVQK